MLPVLPTPNTLSQSSTGLRISIKESWEHLEQLISNFNSTSTDNTSQKE